MKRRIVPILIALVVTFASNLQAQSDQHTFDSLLQLLDDTRLDSSQFITLRRLAYYSPDPNVGIYYGKRALAIAETMSDEVNLADAHLSISGKVRQIGDMQGALEHLFTALKIYQQTGPERNVAMCFNQIGQTYNVLENYEIAIGYLRQAVEISVVGDRMDRLALDYLNLGESYRLSHNLDSALVISKRAYNLYIEVNDEYGIAYAAGNIGLIYAEQGLSDKAIERINEATRILEKRKNWYPIAVYQTYLADIFKDRGDLKLALDYAHESLKLGQAYNLKEQIRDANLKLSELYREKRDFEKAFEYQSQYLVYRDSIGSEEALQKIANLRTEFEVSQKQSEVDLLNEQKRTQQAIGWGLVSGLSLLTVLAILLYRNNQKKLKTNKLLEEQKVKLEESNNTKDKFFSIVSHDLRGPINSFRGISSIIKSYVKAKRTDELLEVTKDIDRSVDGLTGLLDNLLGWAIQQQGRVPNVPEKVNLNELVEDLFSTFNNMAKSKEIQLSSDVDDHINLWVDRNSTMTIVRNLLNNALKFTTKNGLVKLIASQESDQAIIEVSDTGIGIPEDELSELFQLKAKKSRWGTGGEKGLGLGLQLVHEFIEMNNGTIEVKSKVDEGTTFTIKLPLFESQTHSAITHDQTS